jgi:hypothetical protein
VAAAGSSTAAGRGAARVAMSTVAPARVTTCPAGGWHPVEGRTLRLGGRPQVQPGRRHQPDRPHVPDTLYGGRSFRKQRTVNPPIAPSLQLPLLFLKTGLRAAACGGRPRPDSHHSEVGDLAQEEH